MDQLIGTVNTITTQNQNAIERVENISVQIVALHVDLKMSSSPFNHEKGWDVLFTDLCPTLLNDFVPAGVIKFCVQFNAQQSNYDAIVEPTQRLLKIRRRPQLL